MESKINEIKALGGYEISVSTPTDSANHSLVSLIQKSKKQGVPFELEIAIDNPYQPVSIVEVFDAELRLGERKIAQNRPDPFADLTGFGPQPGILYIVVDKYDIKLFN